MILDLIWNAFLNTLFPPACLACKTRLQNKQEKERLLCADCQKQIEINNGFYCPTCRRRLPEAVKTCHPETKFILAAATDYKNQTIKTLIKALKYSGIKNAVWLIAEIFRLYFNKLGSTLNLEKFIIIPVPLHLKKERERGFNQTLLIAQTVQKTLKEINPKFNLQIVKDNLIKIKPTVSQTTLKDFDEKAKNIKDSFRLKNTQEIFGRSILLIDDVFTSGATMREAVTVLKQAGAKKIIGLVLALGHKVT